MSLNLNGGTGIVSANIQDGTIVGADIANGTITADKLDPAALVITYPMLSTSATETDNVEKRVAKAWINFNGSASTIRSDFRCTTVGRSGVGSYTVNLESGVFPNTDYVVVAGKSPNQTAPISVSPVSATQVSIGISGFGVNAQDATLVCLAMFG